MNVNSLISARASLRLWLESSLGIQELTQDSVALLARQDWIVAARLGIYGFCDLAGGIARARATVAQGCAQM